MSKPTEFGIMLYEMRKAAGLSQAELGAAIGKTGQYIYNIEKGKNKAPAKSADVEALIKALFVEGDDALLFRNAALADRDCLPPEQMEYLLSHKNLLSLIAHAAKHNLPDQKWQAIRKMLLRDRVTHREE